MRLSTAVMSLGMQAARIDLLDRVIVMALFLATFLLRWLAYLPSRSLPYAWDGDQYMRIVQGPWSSLIGAGKPFLIPAFYKLLGVNIELMSGSQFVISLLAWGFLAWRVRAMLSPRWLGLVGMSVILAFSANPTVSYWDRSMLSESLSISILAAMLGLGIWLFEKWHRGRAIALALLGFLWGLTRDSNAYALLLLALFLFAVVLFRKAPRGYLAVAAVFVATFSLSSWDANAGDRWRFPLLNVFSQRILRDPEIVEYFANRGMPVTPALMKRAGSYANDGDHAYYNDPELAGFRTWLDGHGKSTYISYLATHPIWALSAPGPDFRIVFSTPDIDIYRPWGMAKPLGGALAEFVSPNGSMFVALTAASLVSFMCAILVRRRRGGKIDFTLPLMLLFFGIAYGYVTWHGDDMEVERHAVQAAILLRLGLWLLMLGCAQYLAQSGSVSFSRPAAKRKEPHARGAQPLRKPVSP